MQPEVPLAKAGPLDVKGEPMMRVSEQRGARFVSVRTGLPVSYSKSAPDSSSDGTFSRWGTPVAVRAPNGAVPFASLPGAASDAVAGRRPS
jgi:hypothetical protein